MCDRVNKTKGGLGAACVHDHVYAGTAAQRSTAYAMFADCRLVVACSGENMLFYIRFGALLC